MKLSRRDWLKAGAVGGAAASFLPGVVAQAARASSVDPKSKWGMGVDPGQTLPPEATDGPWRHLKAVKERKVFDVHCHSLSCSLQGPNYREEAHVHDTSPFKDYTKELLVAMDRHGIAKAALNSAHDGGIYETTLRDDVLPHLDRFIKTSGMPTAESKGKEMTPQMAADIYRAHIRDGCVLIGESSGDAFLSLIRQKKYTVKDLKPMADVVLEHDIPVQFHTGWSAYLVHAYQASCHWAEDVGAVLAAYPEIKFILGHTGGERANPDGWQAVRLAFSFDNAYVDTSKSPPEIVSEVVRGIGAERVMFGSDWNRPELSAFGPFHSRAVYQHWWNLNTIANADLTDDQRNWILYKSARKLLKLPAA